MLRRSDWPEGAVKAGTTGPLHGVRVLDLSRILAGPHAAMMLGDLGADVIKVEAPEGDETRRWGPPFTDDGTAAYYFAANRNKRGIVADFRDADDNHLVRRLAEAADVVIENFRPGCLERFGLDYASVSAANPGLIYCTITGFASGSPEQGRPGFDLVVQAMGGLMSITGEPDRDPVKVGVAAGDLNAGLYAAIAVLGALFGRERTGKGGHLEIPLLDSVVAGLANQSMNWLIGGFDATRMGSDHPNVAPYRAFRTATGTIVVAVGNDPQFSALCEAIDRPSWSADPRLATNAARLENRAWLIAELEGLFAGAASEVWLAALQAKGVPCGPVRSISQVFADPDLRTRLVQTVESPVFGDVPQVRSPVLWQGRPLPIDLPPPGLGEHDLAIREAVLEPVIDVTLDAVDTRS